MPDHWPLLYISLNNTELLHGLIHHLTVSAGGRRLDLCHWREVWRGRGHDVEAWSHFIVAREGGHTVHQLLYHRCQHVGAEGVLSSDAKGLVETLHGVVEVTCQPIKSEY